MADEWKCKKCGGINPGKRSLCLGCNSSKVNEEGNDPNKSNRPISEPNIRKLIANSDLNGLLDGLYYKSENNEAKYNTMRSELTKALVAIGKPAVNPMIERLIEDDINIRCCIIDALGEIKDKRAVEPLIEFLHDKTWYVRSSAATALGKIKDQRAIEYLISQLSDEDQKVRPSVVNALGNIGDKKTVELLIGLLRDRDKWVRYAVIEALGKLGDMRAVEPLIALQNDENILIRNEVEKALAELIPVNTTTGKNKNELVLNCSSESDARKLVSDNNYLMGVLMQSGQNKFLEDLLKKGFTYNVFQDKGKEEFRVVIKLKKQ